MYSLIIDTAKDPGYLLLLKEDSLLARETLPEGSLLSKKVFPLLHFLLKEKHPEALDNLSFVATSRGPGSFTATRMGISIFQTLSFALKAPLLTFTSPELLLPPISGEFTYVEKLKSGNYFILKGIKYPSHLENISIATIPSTSFDPATCVGTLITLEPFPKAISPLDEVDASFTYSYLKYLHDTKAFADPSKISLVYSSHLN